MDLYLIDGNSYVYRAFYAIKSLTNSKGFPTNAIYGFTNMLLKIIREKKPDGLAVSFDSPALTERHRLYGEYKAQRPETPSDLVAQLPYIREIISGFRITIFEVPGYEADDLIGTIARKAAEEGHEVFIVTADKDMLQLVTDHIRIYDPMKERVLGPDYVRERFGVGPERVTEFMALTGDAVDNIPGIKGVGEKTAKELLSLFGSLDELLDHPERIKREKLREMVASGREIVQLSRKLATIDTSVPIDVAPQEFRLREPDWLALLPLFREFEFTSLMKLIPSVETVCEYETIGSIGRLQEVLSSAKNEIAFNLEATGRNPLTDSLVGIAVCTEKGRASYIPVAHSYEGMGKQPDKTEVLRHIGGVLGNKEIAKIGHNLKYDIMLMGREGVAVEGMCYDTMIAAYLLNPNKATPSLGEISFAYLSKRKKSFAEVLKKRASFAGVTIEEATAYAAEDAALSYELKDLLFRKVRSEGLEKVYFNIEMPLIGVLIEMEKAGIRIDSELLRRMSAAMAMEIESIQKRIFFLSGEEFNINSPKQLSKILFQSLGLSPTKKTKTGYSTGMDVLEELAEFHELPREVLHYRSLTKLKTTYLDVLPALVSQETGRLHTSFNQTATATGRLSSSDPNLQNIPIRGEWGKRIREAFIAEEGNILLSADYSQVELRVLAHMSGDEGLIEAFNRGLDIHARTAAELYGLPIDKVTEEMRRTAKTVNFGVIYGISAFGLSETLNIEREDAKRYIMQYFDRHPGVRVYTERVLAEAVEKGFVRTFFGRKRPVPEIVSHNRNTRQLGERLAVNSPIQGTAADIIKLAMINISRRLKKESLTARMILQVHDELLFELPENELDKVKDLVREEMEGALPLAVPVKVEIGHGKNWAEAH
ncbi:MAG: DNA polymerase I [Nitrospiraceae bacterium]|nr:DNA polymerase I [Nitrospiraceae bacterium]